MTPINPFSRLVLTDGEKKWNKNDKQHRLWEICFFKPKTSFCMYKWKKKHICFFIPQRFTNLRWLYAKGYAENFTSSYFWLWCSLHCLTRQRHCECSWLEICRRGMVLRACATLTQQTSIKIISRREYYENPLSEESKSLNYFVAFCLKELT